MVYIYPPPPPLRSAKKKVPHCKFNLSLDQLGLNIFPSLRLLKRFGVWFTLLSPNKVKSKLPNFHLVQNLKVKKEDSQMLSSSKVIVGLGTQELQQKSDKILEKDNENAG